MEHFAAYGRKRHKLGPEFIADVRAFCERDAEAATD
jgi:hypothetical protein